MSFNRYYSTIKNTLLTVSNLLEPVTSLLLIGKDTAIVVDTTQGNETELLSDNQWQQAVTSTFIINNIDGANNIDLVATFDTDVNVAAAALQSALKLTQVGSSVVMRIIKHGAGTASVSINGVEVIPIGGDLAYVLIQSTNVTQFTETIIISTFLPIDVSGFVDLTTNQSIGGTKTFTSPIVLPNGTSTAPSSGFASQASLGWYYQSADRIGLASAGGTQLEIDPNFMIMYQPISAVNGSVSDPSFQFDSSSNTGIYYSGGDVNVAIGGSRRAGFSSTGIKVPDALVFENGIYTSTLDTAALTGNRSITIQDADGTLAFTSEIPDNTDFVDLTTNQSIGGTKTFTSPIVLPNGTSTAPSSGFASQTSLGWYYATNDRIGLSSSGGVQLEIDPNAMFMYQPIQAVNGNVTAPGYALGDSETGFYYTTGKINISISNTRLASFSSAGIETANALVFENGIYTNTVNTTTLTGNRTQTLQNATGTIALTSDIPDNTDFVDLTTNQSIGGTKTFTSPLVLPNGTSTAPSTGFASQTSLGWYYQSADRIGLSSSAGTQLEIDPNFMIMYQPISALDGTVSDPGISFESSSASGLYYASSTMNVAIGGVREAGFSAAGILCPNALVFENGIYTNTLDTAALTGNRSISLQDGNGTLAFTSEIPDNTDFVDLTTNQNVGGVKTFTNSLQLATTGGTAANLSYYEEYSASFTFSGSNISTSGTIKITRIGNMCVLQTPKMTGTANNTASSISSTTTLPTRFIPAATETIYSGGHICANNGASGTGFWFAISQTGTMTFAVVGGGNWNGSVALFIGSISYLV